MEVRRRFSAFVAKDAEPRDTILAALAFTRAFLSGCDLDQRGQSKVAIIVEELVSNSLRHGGRDRDIDLTLELEDRGGRVLVALEDSGPRFDPTQPLPPVDLKPKTEGGIGLAIVQAWGEAMASERHGERNRLTLLAG